MNPTDSALLFVDLPTALARAAQMASFMGCDGVFTKYWWTCIQLTNGQGALIVRAIGPYNVGPTALSGLTPNERAALESFATVQPLLPPSSGIVALTDGQGAMISDGAAAIVWSQ